MDRAESIQLKLVSCGKVERAVLLVQELFLAVRAPTAKTHGCGEIKDF